MRTDLIKVHLKAVLWCLRNSSFAEHLQVLIFWYQDPLILAKEMIPVDSY